MNEELNTSTGLPLDGTPRYRIGTLAHLTGLSAHTIRNWERRYDIISPKRTASGGRLYSDIEVNRLLAVRRLLSMGFNIGQAARMPEPERLRVLQNAAEPPTSGSPDPDLSLIRYRFLESIKKLDLHLANLIIRRATALLNQRELALEVASKVIGTIRSGRSRGEFRLVHERAAISIFQGIYPGFSAMAALSKRAPVAVGTTPAGAAGTFDLDIALLLASSHGWKAVNLGLSLPPSDLIHAVNQMNPQMVLVFGDTDSNGKLRTEIQSLRRHLRKEIELVLGGPAFRSFKTGAAGTRVFPNIADFDRWLAVQNHR